LASNCQGSCEALSGAPSARKAVQTLAEVKPKIEKAQREGTKLSEAEHKGRVTELAWTLKKANYAEETIRMVVSALRTLLSRGANLFDPESVKLVIATQNWSENRKRNVANAYNLYAKKYGITWDKPKTKINRIIPFIPKEEEIDALIAGSGKKLATYLQLLKETGMRSGEATRLKWTDIDEERRIMILNTPEKGSHPRIWKITAKLMNMLNALPRKNQYIFGNPNPRAIRALFCSTRKKLANKLQNPRLLKISFHTFRHWKATTLYHQTKNLLLVKQFLGHAEVDNTLLYIQIEQALYGQSNDDEFTVYGTNDKEEIKRLLTVGFDYVCQKDDILYFRKRK
ncbi:MAG: site-specific integrase, partial [Candidatus Bathyarchaeota archaeon]|nr:site-specific integrase [Candidatus Bathyarchaeota archaeon]